MKTKTKRKKLKHLVTKKKLVRRRTSRRLIRATFILATTLCMSSLAFAIAAAKPSIQVGGKNQLRQGVSVTLDQPVQPPDQVGTASWYALGLPAPDALTCASTTFPRGTYLQVRNLRNGRTVICLVNDYGPEAWTRRVLDLSRGSFRLIEGLGAGTTPIEIRVVPPPPSSFNKTLTKSLGQFVGYNLCRQHFAAKYCDQNRRSSTKL